MKPFFLAVSILVFAFSLHAQTQTFEEVNAEAFKAGVDTIENAVILDLRTPDELKTGMINNAIHIDYFAKDFEKLIDRLDRTRVYFIYCASGGRSGETLSLMEQKGFQRVYNLNGGITAWKKQKMPVKSVNSQ